MKRVLLIIGGGIAAYKCLDLIRRLNERRIAVRCVMTQGAQQFITPLAVGAISNERVATDLFDLEGEREIGHIRMAREADLVVVAPATADLMARMAQGHADDLATAVLLATRAPVLAAPAMNPAMWSHPATQRNVRQLEADGVQFIGPNAGEMAEKGEAGVGRMAEVRELVARIEELLARDSGGEFGFLNVTGTRSTRPLLAGRHVLVTSGPTHEPIDPVRYIANRSSGKQGHAIAEAARRLGARVTLISGPVQLADPEGVEVRHVETAVEMLEAVDAALPADIAVFAAAVADWRVKTPQGGKIKKAADAAPPALALVENPDILATIAKRGSRRPMLVIGFAAETQTVVENAQAKLKSKGVDWIVANDVSEENGVFGGESNRVHLVTASGVEDWPELTKAEVADALLKRAAAYLAENRESV
ncbi:bifunctional phosphopantothenoylcysteine decarboxylase/phosphopantothenate--cysteine ligase CoaBC [Hyphomicrobium sp. CS1GBMeth3]|uniref:bifunctional phosphopantothenoylcysteine decarboxylase/phosphopantothenate--cysteine ligase CoaBC n=1 Tax=Hyphomicrobium sp. CS1GBMeth3 TaxID=1892845 RepID=UPI000930852A|nr:bifunctional phosphopantothenoylcysteine decarboxylase/phosphopantothenate--cysteine ligase CoaBC [Hyphomicrobium sp. CS1GBMeth3]